ncbi:type 2C protein phosphatase PTC1 [Aspergillus clavatus NRRL 1]|uniref:Protein phosphatase 2C, putative n=1 Tax=Aspergillus clavatus (strain ATCC 1007 / CBS 513.65 / DSM 816 / NCTC 3887 / NRRL 1 / QM 1276 / 107) TaxID=344612 RepID=A1CBR9_ASPCL|nr:protein phosphatase 2C, putative [Aspergillus clavatus NRRL 1]EAW13187.1 protein phosphatase 2C, putative [Aspergillus clavatus NRRL 1]
MFSGSSSPPKDKLETIPHSGAINTPSLTVKTDDTTVSQKKLSPPGGFFNRRASEEQNSGAEKKRRSSTVTKAQSLFNNAKNSLSWSSRENSANNTVAYSPPNPLHRLGRMDPALTVPQGSLNNSAGESLPTSRSSFRVGVTEDRNRRCRRTMEDTHSYLYNFLGTPAPSGRAEVNGSGQGGDISPSSKDETSVIETDNGYFAIFDGHAGTFAAEWCGKKLHLILEEVMRRNPNTPVPELLDQTFTSVDQQLEKLPLKNSGCTAVIALLRWEDRVPSSHSVTGSSALAPAAASATESNSEADNTPTQEQPGNATSVLPKLQEKAARQRVLYTANVGDARIVLCRSGKALRLSYDHKGSDENEGKRIANAGGLILNNRVNGVLAVTRALGDTYLKDLVTGHPYTTETVIQPEQDEFIILACDGLWDVCSDQEAVDLIRNIQDAQEASKILVDHALARFSTDNLSCMVIRFDNSRVKEVVDRAVDPIGVEGDPTTHAGYGVSEADKIVEGARKSMANAGLTDNPEIAEKANEELLDKMATDEPGPDVPIDEHDEVPPLKTPPVKNVTGSAST